jgi:NDP-sugar pyrophosphorylase family protein
VDEDGRITSFEEKGVNDGPGWVNAGVYFIRRRLLETIPTRRPVSLERDCLPLWMDEGLYGYKTDGAFLDIGTPGSFAQAEHFFASTVPA